jgi:hypothetical protein
LVEVVRVVDLKRIDEARNTVLIEAVDKAEEYCERDSVKEVQRRLGMLNIATRATVVFHSSP